MQRNTSQDGVVTIVRPIDEADGELFDVERAAIVNAVPRRIKEFTAGRVLAREAMAALGVHDARLPPTTARHPAWPAGIAGSISHSAPWAGVAVARDDQWAAIGLDLEQADRLSDELVERVLLPGERRRFSNRSAFDPTIVFSCKEAVYKAVSPIFDEFLDFVDVEVEIDGDGFGAICHRRCESAGAIAAGMGSLNISDGLIQALFVVNPGNIPARLEANGGQRKRK